MCFAHVLVLLLLSYRYIDAIKTASIFGASGGVGQQISKSLLNNGIAVRAVSRDAQSLSKYNLLANCDLVEADASIKGVKLDSSVCASDYIIISVGTTAFPTEKWGKNRENDPRTACFITVENILESLKRQNIKPKLLFLISSIGIDRRTDFPFKILNLYGVLDQKKAAEDIVLEYADQEDSKVVILRPGRLIGEPFTNFDLAKLLQIKQTDNKGIILDVADRISGDVDRADVAEVVSRLIDQEPRQRKTVLSVVNKVGSKPSEMEWGRLLSLVTVSKEEYFTRRESI